MRTKLARDRETPFVTRPSHLHWRFRVVIGMHLLGVTDMESYAKALSLGVSGKWDVEAAEKFVAFVLCHDNAVIQMGLQDGLTMEAAVELQNSVRIRCKACGTNLNAVPCHTCIANRHQGPHIDLSLSDDDAWLESADPTIYPQPTTAPPGSSEKIAVLRKRFERNEFLHHEHDNRIEHEYTSPWLLRDMVSHRTPGMTPRKNASQAGDFRCN